MESQDNSKQPQTEDKIEKAISQSKGDSMVEDVKQAKSFLNALKNRLKVKLKPHMEKGTEVSKETIANVQAKVTPSKLKFFVRIASIVVFLLILLVVGLRVFSIVQEESGNGGVDGGPTPTIEPYRPYIPSIYTEDEVILQLEEDIGVLDQEMHTTILKETKLNPPRLDFEISF